MDLMKEFKDKHFDLAIVDTPYGLQEVKNRYTGGGLHTKSTVKFGSCFNMGNDYNAKKWDARPSLEYFTELFRVSRNQIIWGANYFEHLPPCRGFIVWDKCQTVENFSACEYAYTSFDMPSKIIKILNHSLFAEEKPIHPTQKPKSLYNWLLTKFAKKGDKILDTHLGSGSIALACHDLGFDLIACEIDKEYYSGATKRIQFYQAQKKLFDTRL